MENIRDLNQLSVENAPNIDGFAADVIARFTKKIEQKANGCWQWNGASRGDLGVANFSLPGGRIVAARRVAFKLWKGPLPDGQRVLMSCLNEMCVNPDHMVVATPKRPIEFTPMDETRFWSKVDKSAGPDGCWPWLASVIKPSKLAEIPYGQFGLAGATYKAHRVAYAMHHKMQLPASVIIRHTCNNGVCCNPEHLITGTQLLSCPDKMIACRRNAVRGEKAGMAKLTDDQVRAIRAARAQGKILSAIAIEFGISISTAGKICAGQLWTHVQ